MFFEFSAVRFRFNALLLKYSPEQLLPLWPKSLLVYFTAMEVSLKGLEVKKSLAYFRAQLKKFGEVTLNTGIKNLVP
ncbi:hypothetical protein [Flagellimonas meridianipacifica]|uniref:Uncharacterized protein n=1 Tax=Flagellimonas meridianipacifica TaxID=1080225 RepID=A0A2T0MFL8_9FLAO|nr:hypothetical protein [Allomuricauda pacifica]PRX56377.1 hypothetical protein CLV81_0374 [Allomuricauda pacifica]